jgi:SNF2 family DNA or RNA helicase
VNERTTWLRERGPAKLPRMLGLIPRRLLLNTWQATQAPAAALAPSMAAHLRAPRLDAGPAATLAAPRIRLETRHRGSVYVADIDVLDSLPGERPAWQQDLPPKDSQAAGWRPGVSIGPDERLSFARLLAAVLQPPLALMLAGDGPLEWPSALRPFQLEGVRALLERTALLLADDMGLGKTIQAIAALRLLLHQRLIRSALIVVPAGLIHQWRDELGRWAPELRLVAIAGEPSDRAWQWRVPAHAYLISYDTLRVDFTSNPHATVAQTWDLVVLDEAQRIKNADTSINRVCRRLKRVRGWALTGTPLENSVDDLASILQWVEQTPPRSSWYPVAPAELRERLRLAQLRRRKQDVLTDLPPKITSKLVIPLSEPQRLAYERAEQQGIVELQALGGAVNIQNVLELIVRLKQICNFDPAGGKSSKLMDLRERVRTLLAEGHRALVFSQFSSRENGAKAIAARLGVPALAYTGDLSQAARERMLTRFREDEEYKVLVLSLRAGGQGLNLQQASYVFHFDRWWNPAVEQQAESRSHRMGQQYPVNVYTYVCEDTIEERVEKILAEKQVLFDQIVDEASIDMAARVTPDELFGLFGLRNPG